MTQFLSLPFCSTGTRFIVSTMVPDEVGLCLYGMRIIKNRVFVLLGFVVNFYHCSWYSRPVVPARFGPYSAWWQNGTAGTVKNEVFFFKKKYVPNILTAKRKVTKYRCNLFHSENENSNRRT